MLMQLEGNTRKKILEIAYFKDLLGTYLLLMDLLETIWEWDLLSIMFDIFYLMDLLLSPIKMGFDT